MSSAFGLELLTCSFAMMDIHSEALPLWPSMDAQAIGMLKKLGRMFGPSVLSSLSIALSLSLCFCDPFFESWETEKL